jgi:hypothetical protein
MIWHCIVSGTENDVKKKDMFSFYKNIVQGNLSSNDTTLLTFLAH